jgi:hypothetical protein
MQKKSHSVAGRLSIGLSSSAAELQIPMQIVAHGQALLSSLGHRSSNHMVSSVVSAGLAGSNIFST